MRAAILGLLLMAIGPAASAAAQQESAGDDPYLWLEDVSGQRAMDWVNSHNAKTQTVLEKDPRYQQYYNEALAIAQAKDRIPTGRFLAGQIYNFWQDADHVRGIWRRTSLADYSSGNPHWETVLDLDALAAADKVSWVWKGASCARPAERRCLINLSDGGEDAVTVREFDLPTKSFVKGGFHLPKGKQDVSWENENSLLVAREWKPGQLTESGYPYIVKRLKRGQPLSAAVQLFSGNPKDVSAGAGVLRDAQGHVLPVISEGTDFFHSKNFVIGPKGHRRIGIPEKAQLVDMVDGRVIIQTQEEWKPAGAAQAFPAGSLLSVDLAALRADPAHLKPTLIYTPGPREALQGASAARDVLLVSILDNVRGRMLAFTPSAGGKWTRSSLDLPDNATIDVSDASQKSNDTIRALPSAAPSLRTGRFSSLHMNTTGCSTRRLSTRTCR